MSSEFVFGLVSMILLIAFLLAGFCLIRGPTGVDRVVALDLSGGVCLGLVVLLAVRFQQEAFLDVALTLAVIGFIGTVALARYLERRTDR